MSYSTPKQEDIIKSYEKQTRLLEEQLNKIEYIPAKLDLLRKELNNFANGTWSCTTPEETMQFFSILLSLVIDPTIDSIQEAVESMDFDRDLRKFFMDKMEIEDFYQTFKKDNFNN